MNIHFIAIGGAAMHNLALAVASKKGYHVTGSDDEIFDPAKSNLAAAGLLPEEIGWHPEKITKDLDAVILGMHARNDNPELLRAKELGLKIYSFPEYLYEQTKDKTRIVIGGSHGKTTTTSMVLYVMHKLGIEADYTGVFITAVFLPEIKYLSDCLIAYCIIGINAGVKLGFYELISKIMCGVHSAVLFVNIFNFKAAVLFLKVFNNFLCVVG